MATNISGGTPTTPLLTDLIPFGRGSGKTVALLSAVQTLFGGTAPFADNVTLIKNNSDTTKLAIVDASLIPTATTNTYQLSPTAGLLAISALTINAQAGNYTPALTDYYSPTVIHHTSSSANNATLPDNATVAFPIGTQLLYRRIGTGQTTFVAGGSSSIISSSGALTDAGRNILMVAIKTATNTWYVDNGVAPVSLAYTPGSVLFAVASTGIVGEDNTHFFWDTTNLRLGVGIGAPLATIHAVSKAASSVPTLLLTGVGSTTNKALQIFQSDGSTDVFNIQDSGLFTHAPKINGSSIAGTWTATANSQYNLLLAGSITARATVSDVIYGYQINPTLILAANTQSSVAVDINPTFTNGAFSSPVNIALRVQSAGMIIGTGVVFAGTEMLLIRKDQNAITQSTIINATSNTAAAAQLAVSVSSSIATASTLFLTQFPAGWTTSGMNVLSTSVINAPATGGLNLGSTAASQTSIWTNNIKRLAIDSNGLFVHTNSAQTSGANVFQTFTQAAQTTAGTAPGLLWTAGAHTSSTTGTELVDINWNLTRTVTIAGSTLLALQRAFIIGGPTYSAASATTWTNVTTLDVTAPTAAGAGPLTFTNNYAARFTGNIALTSAGNYIAIKEGSNAFMGQVALVAGTKAISIAGLTTSDRAFVELVTPGSPTLTIQYQAVCTAGTLTLQANVAAGTINTADTSTLNYIIFRPTP